MPPPHLGNPELPAQKVPLLQQNDPHSHQISDCDANKSSHHHKFSDWTERKKFRELFVKNMPYLIPPIPELPFDKFVLLLEFFGRISKNLE